MDKIRSDVYSFVAAILCGCFTSVKANRFN